MKGGAAMKGSVQGFSKYAIIGGAEAVLDEVILHASDGAAIVVFRTPDGTRRYATSEEWSAGSRDFAHRAAKQGIVTSASSAHDKVALFRSLFKGREDVYGRGFRNRKTGKIGYSTSCRNVDNWQVCPKKKNRDWSHPCADCAAREFFPLEDDSLIAHFNGKQEDFQNVVGLYVLDKDCMTHVLVADFDGDGWKREVSAYRREGELLGIDVAVERSRSGNGGHAWIFFEEPVDAGTARDLGSALLSSAMARSSALGFKAYDRFLPAQSTIPKGGFGNLIALPLQGWAMQQGNSVFVNENFDAYPDQWRYLSGVRKVSSDQARLVTRRVEGGPLGPLAYAAEKAVLTPRQPASGQTASNAVSFPPLDATPIPQLPNAAPQALSASDFPPTVAVVKANMLHIPKEGLSPAARNKIRRLAAFGNPEFYRAQAMRLSVRKKPRIIDLGEEDEAFIKIPRGCEKRLRKLLEQAGVGYQTVDRRNAHASIRVEFKGKLYDRQQMAADALLRHEYGVLSAPTGFGKTVIGAYLVSALKMRTLVIVPDTALLSQWQENFETFLDVDEDLPPLLTPKGRPSRRKRSVVGRIGGGKTVPSGIVDIATYQSLLEKGEVEGEPKCVKELVQDYDLVICDECHHGAAPQLERVLRTVNARRVYGLSATPKREDGLEGIIFMQCGPICHKVDPKEQAAAQSFTRHMLPRFTRIRIKDAEPDTSFSQVLEQVCAHEARNRMIVEDVMGVLVQGRTPFVVTSRKDHAKLLVEKLREAGCEPFLLIGEGTGKQKGERLHAAKSVPKGERLVIVATGSYVGEGFDLPRLDTLLLAAPYSSDNVITQYLGRLHRECDGKEKVLVYDYVDASVPMLDRMYRKRLKSYAHLGYEVMSPNRDGEELGGAIVCVADFQATLTHDIDSASKSVRIVAPYANRKFVGILAPALRCAVKRGIEVSVTIKKPSDREADERTRDAANLLSDMGCAVRLVDGGRSCVAIMDGETVWYGTLPLLAFAKKDDCSLRFKSCEVAHDLAESEGLLPTK